MYYYDIMKKFFQEGVKYLIVGGLAVNLYGIPRVTQDIDIIISMDKDNILKINRVLKELGYIPKLPVNPDDLANKNILNHWIKNKNLKAFSYYHKVENFKTIDIIVKHPLDFENAFQNKTIKNVGDIEIYLVSLDDLIIMKQNIKRQQDISDIKLLRKVKKWMEKDHG
ncbi:MAG: DUF6036 family nucleotidyltransferase [Candidatus Helarchaeota archaeon]